ncbi:hypothetical protein [Kribbella sp. CA-293567]|uniref:hypothetical protein n=1 Tax=Kribbella sp. CA-293567 TaxID=3002436 RepID=UPI0022DD875E|nr:hypothetical protein [Kribbella sp. CA-293567]WBQ03192.1 hypothetical protein OX958_24800 [Kribbella sp. CA-293567]
MAALENLRAHWLAVGTELLVHATRGICDGSLLNADSGRADTSARLEEWSGVLSLYAVADETSSVRVSA